MNRTLSLLALLLSLSVVALIAGCEGGTEVSSVDPHALLGNWDKTSRTVDGVPEVPLTLPLTLCLYDTGNYVAFNGSGYSENGTWEVSGPNLLLHMASNSLGQPARDFTAAIELIDETHFTLTYSSDIGGGRSINIVETFERQP